MASAVSTTSMRTGRAADRSRTLMVWMAPRPVKPAIPRDTVAPASPACRNSSRTTL